MRFCVIRSVVLAAWLCAVSGCAGRVPNVDSVHGAIRHDIARELADLVEPPHEFETGGYVFEEEGRLRVREVRNEYVKVLAMLDEFRRGNVGRRDEFYGLLRSAREIHKRNGSSGVVRCIDDMLASEGQQSFFVPQVDIYAALCRSLLLPHTYRASDRAGREDVLFWFHTHPTGGGPSRYDHEVNEGRMFAVVSRESGGAQVYLVKDSAQRVIRLRGSEVLARR